MNKTALSWEHINWQHFESLTVYLAQDFFKRPFFEKYLKSGNDQAAIDIRDTDPQTGIPVYLQCKHEKLTLAKLRKIFNRFTDETKWERPCQFILATTSDLQTEKLQSFIIEQQRSLKQEKLIDLYIWDSNFIGQELANHFVLVHQYFNLETARRHCLPAAPRLSSYRSFPGYISRRISNIKDNPKDTGSRFERKSAETFELKDLLASGRPEAKSICLIADAYEGKSILLEQTAFELSGGEDGLVPLLVKIKNTVISPIDKLLEEQFDSWLDIPARSLVILLDGLDEVPGDRFLDVVALIASFIAKYPFIRLLFSCRKLFYFNYDLEKKLPGVACYQIEPLRYYQTMEYLERELGAQKDDFETRISRLDFEHFLAYPFYLINLVKWYKEGPGNMPASKIDVVSKFITESLEVSSDRRLSAGADLNQKRARFRVVIRLFALSLQMAGTNAAEKEFMQELFDMPDLELLQAAPVVAIDGKFWSFQNAIYQEQLAALALAELPVSDVVKIVTVGRNLQKIRMKWIQTIASYLSILPEGHSDRARMLEVTEQDNVELLTLADGSKFSASFRLNIIQRIFAKYIKMSARPVVATDTLMAVFSNNDLAIIDFFLRQITQDIPLSIKITTLRTLAQMRLPLAKALELGELAKSESMLATDGYYAKLLLEHLSKYCLGGEPVIDDLLTRTEMLNDQDFRNGIYQLIIAHKLVDNYYYLGIEGIPVLIRHNQGTSHFGSETELEDFLLATNSPDSVKLLYQAIRRDDWQRFYENKAVSVTNFLRRLTENSLIAYRRDSTILAEIVDFIISLGRNHLKDEYEAIDDFFKRSGTNRQALVLYLEKERDRTYHWEFADILTDDCLDLLIDYCQAGRINRQDLNSFIGGLNYRGRNEDGARLQRMADTTFGKEPAEPNALWKLHQDAEANRERNDQVYFQSVEAFAEGIVKYFKVFGKQVLDEEDLYLEPEDKPALVEVDSSLIQSYLSRGREKGELIYLNDCLRQLENTVNFEYWRANRLLTYSFKGLPFDEKLMDILRNYYQQHIIEARFENAHYKEGDSIYFRKREVQLVQIWEKFRFDTPDHILLEFTWMETDGVRGVEHAALNKHTSLTVLLIEHFAGNIDLLKKKILQNFRTGIASGSITASHIGFCRQLKLYEAAPIILGVIEDGKFESYHQYQAIDVYVELNGDKSGLLRYFYTLADYNDYTYIHLAKLLIETYPQQVIVSLQRCLEHERTDAERKLEAARYLAHYKVADGFSYMINILKETGKVPDHIQNKITIWNVDTRWGLQVLDELAYLLVDPDAKDPRFYESPDRYLLEIILGFAGKSEEDLLLVEAFLHQVAERFYARFPLESDHLRWYAERALDNFRNNNQAAMETKEIKKMIRALSKEA